MASSDRGVAGVPGVEASWDSARAANSGCDLVGATGWAGGSTDLGAGSSQTSFLCLHNSRNKLISDMNHCSQVFGQINAMKRSKQLIKLAKLESLLYQMINFWKTVEDSDGRH